MATKVKALKAPKKEKNIYPYAGGYYLNWQLLGHVYRRFFHTLDEAIAEREFCNEHCAEITDRLLAEMSKKASPK